MASQTQILLNLMHWLLFGLGIASFVAAVVVSLVTGQQGFAWLFGGVSAVAVLGYLFNRPLQALEENLQFITWLGIIYNTYWTRLAYILDLDTVQTELESATNDAILKIKELLAAHAKSSKGRINLTIDNGSGADEE